MTSVVQVLACVVVVVAVTSQVQSAYIPSLVVDGRPVARRGLHPGAVESPERRFLEAAKRFMDEHLRKRKTSETRNLDLLEEQLQKLVSV